MKCVWIIALALALGGCAIDMGQDARFGMYGGKQPEPKPEPPFDVMSTKFDTRWFPAQVRWAPDDSNLLVSLCHVNRTDYCRIGKYWIAGKRWELLALQPQVTYRWPSYSPDGKYIAVTAGGCDQNYRCPGEFYDLLMMSNDGKRALKLVHSYAEMPSFSDDGKRIIYWRLTGGGGAKIAMFDLDAGKEEMLMGDVESANGVSRGVHFLPGGERFVFSLQLMRFLPPPGKPIMKDGLVVRDSTGNVFTPHPWDDTKLAIRGPNSGVMRFVWDRRRGALTKANILEADLLWPDGGNLPNSGDAMDVSRTGEVLYSCSPIGCLLRKTEAMRASIKGVDPNPSAANKQAVLALRPAREDAADSAFFVLNAHPQVAALSGDGQRVAFSQAGTAGWHHTFRFGIATLGNPNPEFIDWPRMELDPASTERIAAN